MSTHLTTSRGDRVSYDIRGSGPALIFIAGAGPYRAIDPVTTRTAESAAVQGITTVVYDRLGRGESKVDGRIDLDRELDAVAALIRAAGGSAVLCGHSSGCAIALAAAVRGLPVDGLVLWEAPLGPPDGGAREWAAEVDRRIEAGDLEGALTYYMKDIPPEFLEAWRTTPEFPDLVAQAGSLRPDGESLVWAESSPHTELFAGIDVPVEVLMGEQTYPVMLTAADSLAAAIAGATRKRMPGAGHTWEPEPMAKDLAEFVQATR
ncbi:alpha/beta fold hydrolase [Nocardia mexicana]|uniref:Pimeloyl-ACP methyl ester carboxylesterase n=1 Tax=Nocardia mexicana TaxID=279262 RepID=A0A370GCX6_9NOCA|nr:alpha/beta hydrolase [Nocardia mexicana]RDI41547.1 pimeloyl-ACP methyl ester carboxylesterase [Nocardia mexicana]